MTTMSHAISHAFAPGRIGSRRRAVGSFSRDAGIGMAIVLLVAVMTVLGIVGQPQSPAWHPTPTVTNPAPFNTNSDLVQPQFSPLANGID